MKNYHHSHLKLYTLKLPTSRVPILTVFGSARRVIILKYGQNLVFVILFFAKLWLLGAGLRGGGGLTDAAALGAGQYIFKRTKFDFVANRV
jgi:hypothetical protein